MPSCAKCGHNYTPPVYRNSLCENCGSELKTCHNCQHFVPGAAYDCREPVSEPVLDKNRSNFCDWFKAADDAKSSPIASRKKNSSEAAKQAFSNLFSDE